MRDDFARHTIEIIARRVGYHCSNPDCRKHAYGPSADPTKAVNIGVAAHITAASSGGPRYDPALTPGQRRSQNNGIWLCQNCAKLVDSDPDRYTADILRQWKQKAEQAAEEEIRRRDGPEASSTAHDHANWERPLDRYRQRIVDLYGTTRIFGQATPLPLDDIYTDVYLLDQPTAFHRFDIQQLQADPDLLGAAKRVAGRVFVTQPIAHRLFILGKPGAGKTTLLKHLALEAARGHVDRVPIFVTLKEWADAGEKLLPFIARQFAICGFPDATHFIEHLLDKPDGALVLFDGLDEVQQEGGALSRTIDNVRDFAHQYNRAQCLVTCRTAASDYAFEQFTYVEVADLTPQQMEAFVRKWFHEAPNKADAFLRDIAQEQHRGLRELARIPLLLTMLCLAFGDTLHFPSRRVEIYTDALDALLRKWDASRNVRRDEIYRNLSLGRKHQLLARIAAQSFERGDYFLPQGNLETHIADYLSRLPRAGAGQAAVAAESVEVDGAAVLRAIEAQHGILVERAHRIYSFAHLSFQEYYAARHIIDNAAKGTLPYLLSHCTDTRWREVILLTASLLDNAGSFFVHFRRSLDATLTGDAQLAAYLHWATGKAAALQARTPQLALRSFYCYLDLALNTALDIATALALQLALTLGIALALDRALDCTTALARDLDSTPDCDLDLDRIRDVNSTLNLGSATDFGFYSAVDHARALEYALDRARALDRALGRARDRDLDRDLDRTRAFARALARGGGRTLANDCARTLALANERARTLTLANERARTLVHDLAHHIARDRARTRDCAHALAHDLARALDHALVLSQEIGAHDFHAALSLLPRLGPDAPPGECQTLAETLQAFMMAHPSIGRSWQLSVEQLQRLADYLGATVLLLNCLDVTSVSDRQAIEDTLLLPPGEWHLDLPTEQEA